MLYRRKVWLFVLGITVTALIKAVPSTFISPSQITSAPFSITSPGLYVLTDDVAYNASGGTAITINSSDVTLNLNGKAIINSGAGVENAISLASTFTNITIRNGALRIFDGTGVIVPTGSTHIVVEDVTIVGVNTTVGIGFDLQGVAGATTRIAGVVIKNCNVTNCLRGLNGTAVDAVTIQNSTFNKNGARAIQATDCNNWDLDGCQVSYNSSATEGIGLFVLGGKCWLINNSDFTGNVGGSGAGRGAIFQVGVAGTGGHIIENSMFCDNASSAGTALGLEFQATSSSIIKNCVLNGNFSNSTAATGLSVTGTSVLIEGCVANGNYSFNVGAAVGFIISGTGQHVLNCQANSNTVFAGNGGSNGLRVSSGEGHSIEGCIFNSNASLGVGAAATGSGVLFLAGSKCLVKDCIVVGNSHRGFDNRTVVGANLFIGNSAFGHGVAGVDNYVGVGATPFLSVAATGPFPLAGSFDNRHLANLSFT